MAATSGKMRVTLAALAIAAAVLGLLGWSRPGGVASQASYAAETRGEVPPTAFGMNLGNMRYWSEEFAFLDPIKRAEFAVLSSDHRYVPLADAVPVDAGGHPIGVPAGTYIVATITTGKIDRLPPAGMYDCRISPGWQLRSTAGAKIEPVVNGFTMDVAPSPSESGLRLTLVAKQKADLTQFACRKRGAAPGALFNPAFLADLKPFTVIRFMDWMRANTQPPITWATRTTGASLTQANDNGASVEDMVALVNALGADPWFTLPLEADDSYYRNFATYVRDHLAPGRRCYVEVSNEVWNIAFQQARQALAQGQLRYPQAQGSDPNSLYYADRVRAVMTIWTQVFAGQPKRIVRVFGAQVGNARKATAALSHEGTAKLVDAIAVAPYFGPGPNEVTQAMGDPTEYVLAHGSEFVDRTIDAALRSKAVAAQFGLPLITYEGGPAFSSVRPRLAEAYAKAQLDPRMYDIYTRFLTRWRNEVGGLYVAYDYVNFRFGHVAYTGQPLAEAPKMRALVDFIARDKGAGRARD